MRKAILATGLTVLLSVSSAMADVVWDGGASFTTGPTGTGGIFVYNAALPIDLADGYILTSASFKLTATATGVATISYVIEREFHVDADSNYAITQEHFDGSFGQAGGPTPSLAEFGSAGLTTDVVGVGGSTSAIAIAAGDLTLTPGFPNPAIGGSYSWSENASSGFFSLTTGNQYFLRQSGSFTINANLGETYEFFLPTSAISVISAPVPAPGAALLVGLGLGLVGWFKRRFA